MAPLRSSILAAAAAGLFLLQSVWPVEAVDAAPRVATTAAADASSTRAGPDYFTDSRGKPTLIVSAEDWGLLPNARLNHGGDAAATWKDYFSHRKAQGYNAVEVSLFGYGTRNTAGLDSYTTPEGGDPCPPAAGGCSPLFPFTRTTDPSTAVNATWWNRRATFFAIAAKYGFTVFCNITTPNLNLGTFTTQWSDAQWRDFGTKLAARFKDRPNIKWMLADDYFGEKDAQLDILVKALRAGGDTHPVSIQNYQETSSRQDIYTGKSLPWGAANADYNWGYSYNVSYDVVEKMGNEPNPLPYGWFDGVFLNSGTSDPNPSFTDKDLIRRMVWWAVSSGAKGWQVGDNDMWPWSASALHKVTSNSFYTKQVPAIARTVRRLPHWWELKADTSSQLVTGGRGEHAAPLVSGGSATAYTSNTDRYVTASYIRSGPDQGTLAVIYMSHPSTIRIDQSKLVRGYTATWVDPANGARSAARPGSTYTSSGANSTGDTDWVLVLSARRLTHGATVPGRPAPPQVTTTCRQAVIRWSAPRDGGSAITGYRVTLDGRRHLVRPTSRRFATGRLAVGRHTVSVAARNRLGYGPASRPAGFRIRR